MRVQTRHLPDIVQRTLRVYGHHRETIDVVEDDFYTPSDARASRQGNRGYMLIVDLLHGSLVSEHWGSWGGSNPFAKTAVDDEHRAHPIMSGTIVIQGETGYKPSARIVCRPGTLDLPAQPEVDGELQRALRVICGLKAFARPEAWRREGFGEYNKDNPTIVKLVAIGAVKVQRNGSIRITPLGRCIGA